ncbi:MAG: hypothetical protein KKD69_04385 [Euryarchaeota archaeon]|nr:hypothetical protein [Euryarchaeota archaeon]
MTTLHPLSHYIIGSLLGIRFTHYYLNGPAKIEPTLKVVFELLTSTKIGDLMRARREYKFR